MKRFILMRYTVLILLLACCFQSFSQDFKKQYRKAKDHFDKGEYSAAMDGFNPLTIYDRENPYPEYASFYYALSAQRLGFLSVSKDMLLQVKKVYPTWEQMNEVNYWLSKIYFDQKEYFQALLVAKEIGDESIKSEIKILERTALAGIEDVETLKMILEENPQDEEAGRALARGLSKLKFPNQEKPLLDSLVTVFHLPPTEFVAEEPYAPTFKDRYRVALLLPFLTQSLEPVPGKKKNQFVLDLYEGMKLATDSLNKMSIRIDLLAYDTEHTLESTKRILNEPELKTADFLVGPLFTEEATPVHEFSQQNKINLVVNPVSSNIDLLGTNPFALLYQPSYQTLGIRSAELLSTKVKNKNCIVYYDESPKNAAMAASFMKRAKELGLRITHVKEVRPDNSGDILEYLASATEYNDYHYPTQFKLPKDSIGGIFVASEEALIYTKVINSVETRGDSVVVMGQEGWMSDNLADYSKFERVKVVLAAPNLSSIASGNYSIFRRNYLRKHGVLPTDYSEIGYEFMMVVGQTLKKYGVYFQQDPAKNIAVPGSLTQGYVLQSTRDNGAIPFISFQSGALRVINAR